MIRGAHLSLARAVILVCLGTGPAMVRAGSVTVVSGSPNPIRIPEGIPQIEQAIELFKNRDYEKCQALLQSACASNPDLPPALLIFAKICFHLEQTAMGRDVLEQAAIRHAELPEIHLLFGRLALREKRLSDAQLQFDKALALSTAGAWSDRKRRDLTVDSQAGLAAAAELRKDWPRATAALRAWLAVEPGNGQARRRLGESLFRAGQREKVRAELEQAVKDESSVEPAAIVIARLFTEVRNLEKAGEWMEFAVKRNPDDPRAHLAFASWLLDQDQPERAKTEAEAAARLDPRSEEAKGLCGVSKWHLKDYQAAEQIFKELHLETPGNFTASNFWVRSLAELSSDAQRNRALQMAEINVQLQPKSAEALTTLGWVDYRLGRLDQAEAALRDAMASGEGNSETAYYLARVLADRQKTDEVAKWLKLSLDAPGRFAFRKDAQAWLSRLEGGGTPAGQKPKLN